MLNLGDNLGQNYIFIKFLLLKRPDIDSTIAKNVPTHNGFKRLQIHDPILYFSFAISNRLLDKSKTRATEDQLVDGWDFVWQRIVFAKALEKAPLGAFLNPRQKRRL